jgi:hypothetical protein
MGETTVCPQYQSLLLAAVGEMTDCLQCHLLLLAAMGETTVGPHYQSLLLAADGLSTVSVTAVSFSIAHINRRLFNVGVSF